MTIFQETISEKIWDTKYRYRYHGEIIDQTIEDTWLRVSTAVAKAENMKNAEAWQQKFYDVLAGFRFLPGGRILAGAGTKHVVTLLNCFVMPILEDSLSGVFDSLKEGAMTLQQGGGVGYDFSALRPRGFFISNAGTTASGPVSFMRIWNAMCATMESTGARRGAMMGILRCDHPDIEEFIKIKSDPNELRHFNVSVLVSDAFMAAVKQDSDWELIFPAQEDDLTDTVLRHWSQSAEPIPCRIAGKIKARQLWDKIIKSAYDYAEPGVLFEDTINRQNNLWYREWISATNPCGEIPLPANGACNLGAVNLTQFVHHPFSEKADLNWQSLEETVRIATRFLDNVITVSHYPFHKQKQEVLATRRIGLGVTGLANMLVMLNKRYGSEESFQTAKKVMKFIAETTWQTSIELAMERGVFPAFHAQKYLQGHFVQELPDEMRVAIEKNGIRNSHHNTIAPTGTTSILANNVSNGIEPVFSATYERTVRGPLGSEAQKIAVVDYAARLWQQSQTKEKLPPAWVDTYGITPLEHLKMQACLQPHVDNAISKTINIPVDFPFEALEQIYTEAFQLGLKGCTVFRPNEITGSILQPLTQAEMSEHCCQH